MALSPANTTIATWLGTGAGITASTLTTGAGFWVPTANVATYKGNDAIIENDIRDFLFSVLSKASDSYNATLTGADTRATSVKVNRIIDTSGNITFLVTLTGNTVTAQYISAVGTYA